MASSSFAEDSVNEFVNAGDNISVVLSDHDLDWRRPLQRSCEPRHGFVGEFNTQLDMTEWHLFVAGLPC